MTDPLIVELRDVVKTYPGPPAVEALRGVSVSIAAGEHVAVVGRSGSGKSTLMAILGLLDRPSAGHYALAGVETSQMPDATRSSMRAAHLGFVFQSFHLLPDRDVVENIALGMLYGGCPADERRARAIDVCERVGLAHRASASVRHLSGGEQQRVAIARAIAGVPALLLADEPTGNLDPDNAEDVLALLDALRTDGTTLVVVTHDPEVARRADRRLRMTAGLIEDGEG